MMDQPLTARITLLTDFGTADGYVAAMKGVIASICPHAIIDDAGHDLDPGDVLGAALALERYWRRYPPGTIHVVVVDPGVGSARLALALRADERILVGPDNGVFSRVLAVASSVDARQLNNAERFANTVSPTFHGRDLFAPAAAHLANGRPWSDFTPHTASPVMIRLPGVVSAGNVIIGEVIHIDRFGNLLTNIGREALHARHVRLQDRDAGPVRRTYADVSSGGVVALIGSEGFLEVAVRDGSAAKRLGAGRGTRVEVRI